MAWEEVDIIDSHYTLCSVAKNEAKSSHKTNLYISA